jgi:hypothetical protein
VVFILPTQFYSHGSKLFLLMHLYSKNSTAAFYFNVFQAFTLYTAANFSARFQFYLFISTVAKIAPAHFHCCNFFHLNSTATLFHFLHLADNAMVISATILQHPPYFEIISTTSSMLHSFGHYFAIVIIPPSGSHDSVVGLLHYFIFFPTGQHDIPVSKLFTFISTAIISLFHCCAISFSFSNWPTTSHTLHSSSHCRLFLFSRGGLPHSCDPDVHYSKIAISGHAESFSL